MQTLENNALSFLSLSLSLFKGAQRCSWGLGVVDAVEARNRGISEKYLVVRSDSPKHRLISPAKRFGEKCPMARLVFRRRNVRVIAVACDAVSRMRQHETATSKGDAIPKPVSIRANAARGECARGGQIRVASRRDPLLAFS